MRVQFNEEETSIYGTTTELFCVGGAKRGWDDLDPKTVVLGVTPTDGGALGFPLPAVEAAGGVVEATVGGTDIVLATGDGLYAFKRPDFSLRIEDGFLHGDGTVWLPAAGKSDDGRRLQRVPTRRLYAFAWQGDHGPDAFYATAGRR